jgi:predicted RNA-binding Zn ribbon-like protein
VHWIEQDGQRLPRRLGGHPALDFCNTWAGWGEQSPVADGHRDWLLDYDHLVGWARYAELVDAEQAVALRRRALRHRAAALDVLDQARVLRRQVHAAVTAPEDAEALAPLGEQAARALAAHRLVPATDGRARWAPAPRPDLDLPVLAVARVAADLVTSPAVRDVSACPGVDCGWLFLDPRHRRKWCDMASCGNRAKQAAHARRARTDTG